MGNSISQIWDEDISAYGLLAISAVLSRSDLGAARGAEAAAEIYIRNTASPHYPHPVSGEQSLNLHQRPLSHQRRHTQSAASSSYCLLITPQALIMLSVYPANKVCPSALHAKLTHSGSLAFFPTLAA